MAKKTRGLLAAGMAFAATPQGRLLLQRVKEYATRPETKQRAQQLLAQARDRRKGTTTGSTPASSTPSATAPNTPIRESGGPSYGTPPAP
jgi:hypothetical protein